MDKVVSMPQSRVKVSPEARTIALQLVVAGLLAKLRGMGVMSRDDVVEMLSMVESGMMDGIGGQKATHPEGAAMMAAACREVVGAMVRTLYIEEAS